MRTLLMAGLLVTGACSSADKPTAKTVRVAAASDLAKALPDVAKAFEAKTGIAAVIDFNASGMLAKQIEQGAPYGLFFAANKEFADQAVKTGKCDATSQQLYARGRVIAWTKTGPAPATLAELASDPKWKKIAIADPNHAPYGKAAKEALVAAGLWDKLGDRVVIADSVQAAMTYAREGSADIALVSMSLASAEGGGATLKIDASLYAPLEQTLVVCGTGDAAAYGRQLAEFVLSGQGHAIMEKYGFTPDAVAAAK